jgi:hypothetical protein
MSRAMTKNPKRKSEEEIKSEEAVKSEEEESYVRLLKKWKPKSKIGKFLLGLLLAIIPILVVLHGTGVIDLIKTSAEFYHHFVPVYEVDLNFPEGTNVFNKDQQIVASVAVKRNGEIFGGLGKCLWQIDEGEVRSETCPSYSFSPVDPAIKFNATQPEHKVLVTVKSDSGAVLDKPKSVGFRVRNFDTPKIDLDRSLGSPPILYLREPVKLSINLKGVAPADIQACHWVASAGVITPGPGCTATYTAPASLKAPPGPMSADITAAADITNWPNVPAAPLTLRIIAPAENIFQYILEASARMSPVIFQQAQSRVTSDLGKLQAQDGYLGIRTLEAAGQAPCSLAPPLIPLDSIDTGAKDKIDGVRQGNTTNVSIDAAWAQSIDDYTRFRAGHSLQNPHYFLVTLTAGGETCSRADPVAELGRLNITIANAKLDRDWRSHKLLTFTLVTNLLPDWERARNSKEYREGEAVLILSDEPSVIAISLNAISQLGSRDPAQIKEACQTLVKVLTEQKDERGQARVSQSCSDIQNAIR